MTDLLPEMWALPLQMGWSIIPLKSKDKVPAIQWTAYQSRIADLKLVSCWARSGGNIGIVTGAVSRLLVLDLDNPAAMAEAETRGIPPTVKVATAKGMHCYFAHPGGRIGNRAGIYAGADIRGDGGYVVGPGSIHPTGSHYEWIAAPPDMCLADPPSWLLNALNPSNAKMGPQRSQKACRTESQSLAGECTAYGRAAVERESKAVRCALKGEQELTLNASALKLGALVAGRELTLEYARRELIRAGMCMANHDARNLWTLETVTAKVDRAISDGSAFPRSAPEYRTARDE